MCDRVHYDDLASQLKQVQTNQFRLHQDFETLKEEQFQCKRTIDNLCSTRSSDISERNYQWKSIQEGMALTQKTVSELQKYILGNGTVENSVIYLLNKLADRLDAHIKAAEKTSNRSWDVILSVLKYLAVAAVGAVLTAIYSNQ